MPTRRHAGLGPAVLIALIGASCKKAPSDRPTDAPADAATKAAAAGATPSSPDASGATAAADDPAGAAEVEHHDYSDDPPEDMTTGRPHAPLPPLDPVTAYVPGPGTALIMQRGECFGDCPKYVVGIQGDGAVHFYGERFTATRGYATAHIDKKAVGSLLTFLGTKRFDQLHTTYKAHATDHPKVVMILRQGDRMKYVEHDTSNDSEPALIALAKEIDRVASTARWVGTAPSAGGRGTRGLDPGLPPIPSNAIVRMLGDQLDTLQRACHPTHGARADMLVRVGVDELGHGRASGGGAKAGSAKFDFAAYHCVAPEVTKLTFPLVSIPNLELPITLVP